MPNPGLTIGTSTFFLRAVLSLRVTLSSLSRSVRTALTSFHALLARLMNLFRVSCTNRTSLTWGGLFQQEPLPTLLAQCMRLHECWLVMPQCRPGRVGVVSDIGQQLQTVQPMHGLPRTRGLTCWHHCLNQRWKLASSKQPAWAAAVLPSAGI